GDRALLRAGRLVELPLERADRAEDLLGRRCDVLDLTRAQLPVGPDRRIADELADLLRVLGRKLLREVLERARDECARVLERRQHLLLGPVVQAAGPEVVVLVEAL